MDPTVWFGGGYKAELFVPLVHRGTSRAVLRGNIISQSVTEVADGAGGEDQWEEAECCCVQGPSTSPPHRLPGNRPQGLAA